MSANGRHFSVTDENDQSVSRTKRDVRMDANAPRGHMGLRDKGGALHKALGLGLEKNLAKSQLRAPRRASTGVKHPQAQPRGEYPVRPSGARGTSYPSMHNAPGPNALGSTPGGAGGNALLGHIMKLAARKAY